MQYMAYEMCIYIPYIHTCMHTYIHTYVRTYVRTYVGTYLHKDPRNHDFGYPSCTGPWKHIVRSLCLCGALDPYSGSFDTQTACASSIEAHVDIQRDEKKRVYDSIGIYIYIYIYMYTTQMHAHIMAVICSFLSGILYAVLIERDCDYRCELSSSLQNHRPDPTKIKC